MRSAGVGRSDLHLWQGGYVGPGGSFMKVEDRGVNFHNVNNTKTAPISVNMLRKLVMVGPFGGFEI
ncbi:MAG TPA: hypothetical protein VFS97_07450 [Nitrososphaeraceae archaeon]|nr:hypothetical protein [Nitrososphaeraceae archaeon]